MGRDTVPLDATLHAGTFPDHGRSSRSDKRVPAYHHSVGGSWTRSSHKAAARVKTGPLQIGPWVRVAADEMPGHTASRCGDPVSVIKRLTAATCRTPEASARSGRAVPRLSTLRRKPYAVHPTHCSPDLRLRRRCGTAPHLFRSSSRAPTRGRLNSPRGRDADETDSARGERDGDSLDPRLSRGTLRRRVNFP